MFGLLKCVQIMAHNIELEERQLVLEYKTTTICISRRDEGLQETEEVVDDSKEQIVSVNLEMIKYVELMDEEEDKCQKKTGIV
ncbi:MAG: hypothetical protein EZS28_010102 [Streblomastix strix]|uniref:Uncharacterized protein n=1 Tax=Streblomastix strix TaxID=222440 RepID=A0A5J4WHJ1_9EUKA|nr:MAG: hypothetical protein EZS28_010102 [Streblomastix strix]